MFTKYQEFIKEDKTSSELNLAFLGDIFCEELNSPDSDPFRYIKPILLDSDFVCANLETTFSGFISDREYIAKFSTDDSFIKNLNFIDLLFTANNHSLDYGIDGLMRTIDIIKGAKIDFVGTSKFEKNPFKIFSINGVKVSFISSTQFINERNGGYSRINSIQDLPSEWKDHLEFYDKDLMISTIKEAKSLSDLVVVYIHLDCKEYEIEVESEIKSLMIDLKKQGADLIIGGQPHVFRGGDSEITYSLGNFFGQYEWPKYPLQYGCILFSEIQGGKIRNSYLPISTIKNDLGNHYVIPLSYIEENRIKGISKSDTDRCINKLTEIRNLLKKMNLIEYKVKED
jgi:poly-gamma-glutamate capsule biosynthesis protein CapA/YwtB (metallophosphatase superfamily)